MIFNISYKTLIMNHFNISYKTLIDPKPYKTLIDPKTRYFKLFTLEEYETIFCRIRFLISEKSDITYILSHYFPKLKVDSYDFLPIEKILTLHNAIMHIKSILNKDKNHYYYKIILENCSYQLAKK